MKIPQSRKRDSRGGGGSTSSSSSSEAAAAASSLVPLKLRCPAEYLQGRPDVRELVSQWEGSEQMWKICVVTRIPFCPHQVRRLSGPELGVSDARVEESREGTISIHLVRKSRHDVEKEGGRGEREREREREKTMWERERRENRRFQMGRHYFLIRHLWPSFLLFTVFFSFALLQDSLDTLIKIESNQTHVLCHDVSDREREATRRRIRDVVTHCLDKF